MRTILFLLSISLFFTACAPACQESALSDIVLTDPSLLQIKSEFTKDVNTAGLDGENVSVWIRDKNSQALSLKKGKVLVNDTELSVFKSFVGKLPYYNASGSVVHIKENQNYNVDIVLGDGKKYSSQISIPEKSLKTFDCPNTHNGSEHLVVKWNELSPEYLVVLSWTKKVQTDSAIQSFSGSKEIINHTSEYEFPSTFFMEGNKKVTELEIELRSTINGRVSSDFRSNSSISATFSIDKKIIIE